MIYNVITKAQEHLKTIGKADPSRNHLAALLDTISAIREELRMVRAERDELARRYAQVVEWE